MTTWLMLTGLLGFVPPVLASVPGQTMPSPQNSTPAETEDGYLLGPGDRVKIDFFSVPEYTGEYQVLPNGTVNLPQIGAVSVQGKTLKQASEAIASQYQDYLTRPIITISLIAARPITIAIAGEVNRPGSYTVPAAATGDNTNVPIVTRLIKLAGGTTQAADIRQVEIRRQRSINSGGNEVIKVDLIQLVQSGDIQQDLRLRDGDSIFIPSTTSTNLDEARQLASTNFAAVTNRPLRIAVVGEVNRPGPYTLTEKPEAPVDGTGSAPNVQVPTVTQAIQTAGGITQSADIRNIQVRRMTKTGPEQAIKIDFWQLLQSGDLRQDLPLQDGDTIVIPTATALSPSEATKLASASFAPGKITVNVVGEVVKPGPVEVPPNTPLSQALLAAGGFNARARKQSVTFIRLNPNGTVSQRAIAIDFSKGINDETNPALRNNDTIIVGKSTIAGITDTLGSFLSPVTGVLGLIRLLGF